MIVHVHVTNSEYVGGVSSLAEEVLHCSDVAARAGQGQDRVVVVGSVTIHSRSCTHIHRYMLMRDER